MRSIISSMRSEAAMAVGTGSDVDTIDEMCLQPENRRERRQ